MRKVCLNSPRGAACYGDYHCESEAKHNEESVAFAKRDFLNRCPFDNTTAVVCTTGKCLQH